MNEKILDYEYIKTLFLQQGKGLDKTKWFLENADSIQGEILERVHQAYALEPRTDLAGQAAFYSALPSEMDDLKESDHGLYLSSIVHAGCFYRGQTCHRIIFGEDKPVFLSGKTRSVVLSLMDLTYPQIRDIYSYLQANVLCTNNPCYVLRARCLEQAAQEGVDITKFISHKAGMRTAAVNLFKSTPVLSASTYKGHNFHSSPSALFLVLSSCVRCDMPADYFLVQDYSSMAFWEDQRKLSRFEMDFLSTYLNATPEAQESVIRFIGYCSLGMDIPLDS